MTITDTRFILMPADDPSMDDEYAMIGHPDVTIQVALYAGGYIVNEYERDEHGEIFAMLCHGSFIDPTDAVTKALEIAGVVS